MRSASPGTIWRSAWAGTSPVRVADTDVEGRWRVPPKDWEVVSTSVSPRTWAT